MLFSFKIKVKRVLGPYRRHLKTPSYSTYNGNWKAKDVRKPLRLLLLRGWNSPMALATRIQQKSLCHGAWPWPAAPRRPFRTSPAPRSHRFKANWADRGRPRPPHGVHQQKVLLIPHALEVGHQILTARAPEDEVEEPEPNEIT